VLYSGKSPREAWSGQQQEWLLLPSNYNATIAKFPRPLPGKLEMIGVQGILIGEMESALEFANCARGWGRRPHFIVMSAPRRAERGSPPRRSPMMSRTQSAWARGASHTQTSQPGSTLHSVIVKPAALGFRAHTRKSHLIPGTNFIRPFISDRQNTLSPSDLSRQNGSSISDSQ
jgi:hypothetical protein